MTTSVPQPADSRLRVLHVLEALEGGTARHVVDLVRHANGVDHEVVLPPRRIGGCTDTTAAEAMAAAGATLHRLDLRRSPFQPANAVAIAKLARLLRERRPAVLHAHSSIGGLVGRVAARTIAVPVVYTPNGITNVRAGIAVERALGWASTNVLVAVSESERQRARELHLTGPRRIIVIPNGIDLSPAAPSEPAADLRKILRLPDHARLVGTISRLVPQKAPEDLVEAFTAVAAPHPDAHLIVVGDGPLRESFDGAVARHGLQGRVHRIPYLANASAVLDQLEVFMLASRFEGAPYAPMEAMRAGTPVVATDVVGTRDVIEHGVSGLLAPFGRPDQLGGRVADLLDDPGRREQLRRGATARLAKFDVRLMGRCLGDLYLRLAGDAPRRRLQRR